MYTALAVMLAGILAGRLLRNKFPASFISPALMASILLLLFLMGASIGSNQEIILNLPAIGASSLILMLFCAAGSIAAAMLAAPFLRRSFLAGSNRKKAKLKK